MQDFNKEKDPVYTGFKSEDPTFDPGHNMYSPAGKPVTVPLHEGEMEYPIAGSDVRAIQHDVAFKAFKDAQKPDIDKTKECSVESVVVNLKEERNPISRLMQIQRTNKENDPVYTVIEEHGATEDSKFVIEGSLSGHICLGVGPKKKVAKRNAAEGLLVLLGYKKIAPALPSVLKPDLKVPEEAEIVKKPHKLTIIKDKKVDGSGGCQLAPSLISLCDPSGAFGQGFKSNDPTFDPEHNMYSPTGKPVTVPLHEGEIEYPTAGSDVRAIKHDVAFKALKETEKQGIDETKECSVESVLVTEKKNHNTIKVISERNSELIEERNPIARLMQIQRTNKEEDPVYIVIEEHGLTKDSKYVIEGSLSGHICQGVGPTKKVAKRNAAEALLILLGYKKIVPVLLSVPKPALKVQNEAEFVKKPCELTSMGDKNETLVGGSGGCQFAPNLILLNDLPGAFEQNKSKVTDSEIVVSISGTKLKKTAQIQVPDKCSQWTQTVGAEEKLCYLSQLLGAKVQFSDFCPTANNEIYTTVVCISTNSQWFCHGKGLTNDASRENAAKKALDLLFELALDNVNYFTTKLYSHSDTAANQE